MRFPLQPYSSIHGLIVDLVTKKYQVWKWNLGAIICGRESSYRKQIQAIPVKEERQPYSGRTAPLSSPGIQITARFLNGKKPTLAAIQLAAVPEGGELAVSQPNPCPRGLFKLCTKRWYTFTIPAAQPRPRKPPSYARTHVTCHGWCCRPE